MSKTAEKTETNLRASLLARPVFFPRRFIFEKIIFAEMPAGEGSVHDVVIHPENGAFYCTCPFRPKPCIHALALNELRRTEGDDIFTPIDALPEWAGALLAGLPASRLPGAGQGDRIAEKQQRRFERLERAAGGFEDLETWLLDTIRRGVATAVSEDPHCWENIAARMADASMTGISRTLRLLGKVPASDPAWAEKVTAGLAECYLAARAFHKRDVLSENMRYDLQTYIGIALKKEEVLSAGERLSDSWAVVGQFEEPLEEKLAVRRSWMLSGKTGRFALLLDFAFGGGGFLPGFRPGTIQQGTMVFYPSSFPQRVLALDDVKEIPKTVEKLPGFADFDTFAAAYSTALAAQPWLSYFPAVLNPATVIRHNKRFYLTDPYTKSLPLYVSENDGWRLLALGGGEPISVFGEWDGAMFRPSSAVAGERFVVIGH